MRIRIFIVLMFSLVVSLNSFENSFDIFKTESDYIEYQNFLETLKNSDRDLIMALRIGDYEMMVNSLKAGANINVKDFWGRTPLFIGSIRGFDDMVRYLLLKKANINLTTNSGTTPLIGAVATNRYSTVRILLDAKPKLNLKESSTEMSALDYADIMNNHKMVLLLKSKGAK